MTTHKYTPGPWFADGLTVCDKRVWFDEAGARHGDTPNMVIKAMSAADAALISAAPDLLEALGYCEIWFSKHAPSASLITGNEAEHPMLTCIRAAIAKATGGAE